MIKDLERALTSFSKKQSFNIVETTIENAIFQSDIVRTGRFYILLIKRWSLLYTPTPSPLQVCQELVLRIVSSPPPRGFECYNVRAEVMQQLLFPPAWFSVKIPSFPLN